MSSKRKAQEQAPDTEKTKKTASSLPAEEKAPKTLNFDDDEAPAHPKWGSDPDALNGRSNAWEVKLVNTTNPATSEKTDNVCVLYRLPYNLQWKKPQIQEAVQKVAFGGNVSPVNTKHSNHEQPARLRATHERSRVPPSADDPPAQRPARHGQVPKGSASHPRSPARERGINAG